MRNRYFFIQVKLSRVLVFLLCILSYISTLSCSATLLSTVSVAIPKNKPSYLPVSKRIDISALYSTRTQKILPEYEHYRGVTLFIIQNNSNDQISTIFFSSNRLGLLTEYDIHDLPEGIEYRDFSQEEVGIRGAQGLVIDTGRYDMTHVERIIFQAQDIWGAPFKSMDMHLGAPLEFLKNICQIYDYNQGNIAFKVQEFLQNHHNVLLHTDKNQLYDIKTETLETLKNRVLKEDIIIFHKVKIKYGISVLTNQDKRVVIGASAFHANRCRPTSWTYLSALIATASVCSYSVCLEIPSLFLASGGLFLDLLLYKYGYKYTATGMLKTFLGKEEEF